MKEYFERRIFWKTILKQYRQLWFIAKIIRQTFVVFTIRHDSKYVCKHSQMSFTWDMYHIEQYIFLRQKADHFIATWYITLCINQKEIDRACAYELWVVTFHIFLFPDRRVYKNKIYLVLLLFKRYLNIDNFNVDDLNIDDLNIHNCESEQFLVNPCNDWDKTVFGLRYVHTWLCKIKFFKIKIATDFTTVAKLW